MLVENEPYYNVSVVFLFEEEKQEQDRLDYYSIQMCSHNNFNCSTSVLGNLVPRDDMNYSIHVVSMPRKLKKSIL